MDQLNGKLYNAFASTYDLSVFKKFLEADFVTYLIKLSIVISLFLFIITLIQELYQSVIGKDGSYATVIIRAIIVSLILGSYSFIYTKTIETVDNFAFDFFAEKLNKDTIGKNQDFLFEDVALSEEEKENLTENNDQPQEEKKTSLFGFSFKLSDISPTQILVQISIFLSSCIIFVINAIRSISLTIFYVIGPLCIITFMNRNLQTYGFGWLKSFANVLIWPILILLVLNIQSILLESLYVSSNPDIEKAKIFSYNIVFIFMLVKVMSFLPSLASGSAGAFSAFEGLLSAGVIGGGIKAAKLGSILTQKGIKGAATTIGNTATKTKDFLELSNPYMKGNLGQTLRVPTRERELL